MLKCSSRSCKVLFLLRTPFMHGDNVIKALHDAVRTSEYADAGGRRAIAIPAAAV
jgi:hypothetical protein